METLTDLDGTRWSGRAELWTDPLGDEVQGSDCTIAVAGPVLQYTWSFQGEAKEGRIHLTEDGAEYSDSWHQAEPVSCRRLPDARGLFQLEYAYGPDSDWGWRIGLFHRAPTGELVLQMTNIAPWGEEARAVRMSCQRAS